MTPTPIRFASWPSHPPLSWPWWKAIAEWFVWRGWFYDCRTYWRRARYGWAPRDVWSLDHYLNGVLGGSLRHLAETNHGVPGGYLSDPNGDCTDADFERWKGDLRRWADAFRRATDELSEIHGEDHDAWSADEAARTAAVHVALKEMEPWWEALWD